MSQSWKKSKDIKVIYTKQESKNKSENENKNQSES